MEWFETPFERPLQDVHHIYGYPQAGVSRSKRSQITKKVKKRMERKRKRKRKEREVHHRQVIASVQPDFSSGRNEVAIGVTALATTLY